MCAVAWTRTVLAVVVYRTLRCILSNAHPSFVRVLFLLLLQQFTVLTASKPDGRRWVTKEQYIRYFCMCYDVLYPGHGLTMDQRRAAVGVRCVFFP